jgi:hypothetical protein
VPGIVFKLKILGAASMSFAAAKAVGWIYSAIAIAATIVFARRPLAASERPLAWLAILILATLRSPFLPDTYAVFPALWLLTLVAAVHAPDAKTLWWTVAAWVCLSAHWPPDWQMDPRLRVVVSAVPQAVLFLLPVLVLRRALAPRTDAAASPAGAGATLAVS